MADPKPRDFGPDLNWQNGAASFQVAGHQASVEPEPPPDLNLTPVANCWYVFADGRLVCILRKRERESDASLWARIVHECPWFDKPR